MEIRSAAPQWRRVILAALQLAALYAVASATCLIAVGVLVFHDPLPLASELPYFALPLVVAFLVLAVARRAGFALLWLLLVGLWVRVAMLDGPPGLALPTLFLSWSALAAPLFAIGALGVPSQPNRPASQRVPRPLVVSFAWALLAVLALSVVYTVDSGLFFRESGRGLNALASLLWLPVPVAIAIVEVTRVWIGTSPVASDAPAV